MRKHNSSQKQRVQKVSKPRNPVQRALVARTRSGGTGAHVKSRGADRRREKMALQRQLKDSK